MLENHFIILLGLGWNLEKYYAYSQNQGVLIKKMTVVHKLSNFRVPRFDPKFKKKEIFPVSYQGLSPESKNFERNMSNSQIHLYDDLWQVQVFSKFPNLCKFLLSSFRNDINFWLLKNDVRLWRHIGSDHCRKWKTMPTATAEATTATISPKTPPTAVSTSSAADPSPYSTSSSTTTPATASATSAAAEARAAAAEHELGSLLWSKYWSHLCSRSSFQLSNGLWTQLLNYWMYSVLWHIISRDSKIEKSIWMTKNVKEICLN